jgi:serine/threonine-protein kinase 24/25/MST4
MAVDGEGVSLWNFPLGELSPSSTWEKVGEGSFGNVYKASLLGTPVAVKENASSKDNRVLGIRRDIAYLRRAEPQ